LLAKKVSGFFSFAPLIAGLWLPVTAVSGMLLKGNQLSFYIMNSYSFCSFFLLGLMIYRHEFVKDETLGADFEI
jgi:hypothetical protein